MRKSRQRAFTIIEIVIVIAVIAVLSAILIPTFGSIIQQANDARAESELRDIEIKLEMAFAKENPIAYEVSLQGATPAMIEIKIHRNSDGTLWAEYDGNNLGTALNDWPELDGYGGFTVEGKDLIYTTKNGEGKATWSNIVGEKPPAQEPDGPVVPDKPNDPGNIPMCEEHQWGEWFSIGSSDTPCQERTFRRICKVCLRNEDRAGTDDDHRMELSYTVAASCTNPGYTVTECIDCPYYYTTETEPQLNHMFFKSADDESHFEACKHCGERRNQEEHYFIEGKCECGETESLDFTLVDDSYYIVSGIGNIIATDIVIPSEYNDLPVIGIGENAFENCANIRSVELPDSIIYISSFAFFGCSSLTNIIIPESVTLIDGYAFANCGFTDIVLPDSIQTLGTGILAICFDLQSVTLPSNISNIPAYTFSGCTKLTNVTIPDSVTQIEFYAFSQCHSLTNIKLPNRLEIIGDYAFTECESLNTIDIPDLVTTIGDEAFSDCTALETIELPDSLTTIGGGAFSNCTALETIELPDSLTSLGASSFRSCTSLTSIKISEGVSSIEYGLFMDCTSLTSIYLPSTITTINRQVIQGCPDKLKIYYNGTAEQWEDIVLDGSWNHGCKLCIVYDSNNEPILHKPSL